MKAEPLEAWEFGDPVEVVARREARERNAAAKLAEKQRNREQRLTELLKQSDANQKARKP